MADGASATPGTEVTAFTPVEDEKTAEPANASAEQNSKAKPDMSRASSASSLFHPQNSFAAIEKGDVGGGRHEAPSFFSLVKENIVVIGFITFLLAFTLVCSLVEVMRLPICAFQVLCIGLVSVKWEEGAWLATEPRRGLRLTCQLLMLIIPLAIAALLVFIIVSPSSDDDEVVRR